jgi:DNA repair protein RadC
MASHKGPRYVLGPEVRVSLVREGQGTPPHPELKLDGPKAVVDALWDYLPDDGREHFGVVLLDVRHRCTGLLIVSVGCLTASLVHPREVFGPALQAKAAALVLFHTHPSGNPEPSAEDLALTRRLGAGGDLLGVPIVDHVVLGMGTRRWVSLKERGVL